ncbi:Uncharacterised protein [Streptococcus dysgalactiae subsp. equisimilis]|nr:Uncharacterised protein [Streptococcus dysgalactiae subsp. equisimilis]
MNNRREKTDLEPSHPSRVSGLKFKNLELVKLQQVVSPFAGEWIEISTPAAALRDVSVSPFAGEWIEITMRDVYQKFNTCLTLRG